MIEIINSLTIKRVLLTLLVVSPILVNSQWSISAEYLLDPGYLLKSEEHEDFEDDQSIIKELNIAANYNLGKRWTLKVGLSRTDKKNASNYRYYIQDNFIPGQVIQVQNLTLRHRSKIRTYSAFAGFQFNYKRLHFVSHAHYAYGVFKDPAIVGREYSSLTGITNETFYDINYEHISFFKADLSFVCDLLKSKKGTISIVAKYASDFTLDKMFTVSSYDLGLRQMVEDFPGSSYYDLDEFLEGGPLYYDREFWGFGLKMTYNLTENIDKL